MPDRELHPAPRLFSADFPPPLPVPPVPEPTPPLTKPRLTQVQAHVLTGVAIIALMGAAGFINAITSGALVIPPQYAPLAQYAMVPLTMLVMFFLNGLRTGNWDAPMAKKPTALLAVRHCAECPHAGQEAPCEHC